MNKRALKRALCLMVCACMIVGCKGSYNPSSIPAQTWFNSKNSSRKPKLAKPTETHYSGLVYQNILDRADSSNTNLIIDIADQKGYLMVNGQIAASSPVSTAKPGKHTPTGTFRMTERVRSGKISTIYKVAMPYWMRLDQSPIGVHAGYVPGYPASAGCIRLPYDMARLVYDHTQSGTKVTIYSDWSGN